MNEERKALEDIFKAQKELMTVLNDIIEKDAQNLLEEKKLQENTNNSIKTNN